MLVMPEGHPGLPDRAAQPRLLWKVGNRGRCRRGAALQDDVGVAALCGSSEAQVGYSTSRCHAKPMWLDMHLRLVRSGQPVLFCLTLAQTAEIKMRQWYDQTRGHCWNHSPEKRRR